MTCPTILPTVINLSQRVQKLWSLKYLKSVIRGGNSNIKAVGVTIFVCDMPPWPVLHTYEMSSNYLQGYWSLGLCKVSWFNIKMGSYLKIRQWELFSCMWHTYWTSSPYLPNIIKFRQFFMTEGQTYRQMLQGLTLEYVVHNLRLCYDMIIFQVRKGSVQWWLR